MACNVSAWLVPALAAHDDQLQIIRVGVIQFHERRNPMDVKKPCRPPAKVMN
jgi:hypothetical protein